MQKIPISELELGSLLKLTNQKLAFVAKSTNDPSDPIELLVFYDLVTKTNTPIERIELKTNDALIDCIISPKDFEEELQEFLKIISD